MHYNTKSLQKQKLFQTIPLWVYISGKTVFHFLCKMIRRIHKAKRFILRICRWTADSKQLYFFTGKIREKFLL